MADPARAQATAADRRPARPGGRPVQAEPFEAVAIDVADLFDDAAEE